MTKAIIFDLDSCHAAADVVGEQLFAPTFAAIRAANEGWCSVRRRSPGRPPVDSP